MEFFQVDVFTERAYRGNPLAVFADAAGLTARQMQAIASEMNLSETTFVTSVRDDAYDVRIFTPTEELPFAGHPTLGTTWVLGHLGLVASDEVIQRSGVSTTRVRRAGDLLWLERAGEAKPDLESSDPSLLRRVADALALDPSDLGLEARELGRAGRLRPAFSDAGLSWLMVPVSDVAALGRCLPRVDLLGGISREGAYCFTATGAGRLRARGFAGSLGAPEDPGTGSAAAALGIYLSDRLGPVDAEIDQGVEMGRPCRISIRARDGRVEVGGRCTLVFTGRLEELPEMKPA